MADSFLYFGFGSNLLKDRIHLRNPTAKFVTTARLQGYTLEFHGTNDSEAWHGAVATIVPDETSHVWGVLWRIGLVDMPHLDAQEGVDDDVYIPIEVNVQTADGEDLVCRTYQMNPEVDFYNHARRPSPHYLDVILRGARENSLPEEYIEQLEQIEHNGYSGPVGVNVPAPSSPASSS